MPQHFKITIWNKIKYLTKFRIDFLCSIIIFNCLFFLFSCTQSNILFDTLDADKTNLNIANTLSPTPQFNALEYMYFYNGGGLAAADFNNDGQVDLFFTTNQNGNKLFLNSGKLKFKDVSTQAHIPKDSAWNTGVAIVDINNDGLLDIYICRVGAYLNLKAQNQLLICQGIEANGTPKYKDMAAFYGLNISAFCTQAAFFDYDIDGDLDFYLLNHAVHHDGSYKERSFYKNQFDSLAGDRFFENINGKFIDKTKQLGIQSSTIGYGLGISVADINLDGYADMYVANDFHENDYLYINQKNKTFKDLATKQLAHSSKFAMGVDIADINNDFYPEIMCVDMQPENPKMLRKSLGEDNYAIFNFKQKHGYQVQYPRNSLQLNDGNNHFKEIAHYANVAASDWSWSPLILDFNNDGYKDIFISNGIPKRLNDIDYINFISNKTIQNNIINKNINQAEQSVLNKFPEIKLPNKFYVYDKDLQFKELANEIKNAQNTFSNSAVYADFDNDGDIDIVVNNINQNALIYENKSATKNSKPQHELHLKSKIYKNSFAIGSKLMLFTNKGKICYQHYNNHGFQSSSLLPFYIPTCLKIDSALLIWQDNSFEKINTSVFAHDTVLIQTKKTQPFNYASLQTVKYEERMTDITNNCYVKFKHNENIFSDFDSEALMPFLLSTATPFIVSGDIDNDGLQDFYIGTATGQEKFLYQQITNGKFKKLKIKAFDDALLFEDADGVFADVNNDGFKDLIIASGGNQNEFNSQYYNVRLYINDKKNNFNLQKNAFDKIVSNASTICVSDINKDGFLDVFVGSNAVPFNYGKIPNSYLFINNKRNKFVDETKTYSKDLQHIGFVNKAEFVDINNDTNKELIIATQWGGIFYFELQDKQLIKKIITTQNGFWNNFLIADYDKDGRQDILATNFGINNRFHKASIAEPLSMYVNDFDDNAQIESVLTYYLQGKEITVFPKAEIEKQIPKVKKKFLYAEDYANASIDEILGKSKTESAEKYTAYQFHHTIFLQQKSNFKAIELPYQTQLSQMHALSVIDINEDGFDDIVMAGNFYDNNIPLERSDASKGLFLINKHDGNFEYKEIKNDFFVGQIRQIKNLEIGKKKCFAILKNNDSLKLFQWGNNK